MTGVITAPILGITSPLRVNSITAPGPMPFSSTIL
ncbi:MAG: hypothetical protein ACD_36C00175G0003 [uncultured bacterium]|nr:MAG: hypothetical protein ACD_36C00175G0003 [uncultured bacterium]